MFIKFTHLKNAVLYVEAKGKLDIYNAQDYLDGIKENITYTKELILEFSQIPYITSIGLRVILELQKIMKERDCKLKLKNVNEDVMHAFEITGFDKFLTIEHDVEDNKDSDNNLNPKEIDKEIYKKYDIDTF